MGLEQLGKFKRLREIMSELGQELDDLSGLAQDLVVEVILNKGDWNWIVVHRAEGFNDELAEVARFRFSGGGAFVSRDVDPRTPRPGLRRITPC